MEAILHAPKAKARPRRNDLRCSECQRCFTKPEHLRRHSRVHSGSKPFTCTFPGCCRQFNRSDSLIRHQKTHAIEASDELFSPADVSTLRDSGDDTLALPTYTETPAYPSPDEDKIQVGSAVYHDPTCLDPQLPEGSLDWPALPSWPETEEIFNFLSSDLNPVSFGLEPFPQVVMDNGLMATTHGAEDGGLGVSTHSRQALHRVTSLVQDFSSTLFREVETTGMTTELLDMCLGFFIDQFLPVFPVLHQPTFSLRECSPPLLLNIVAIGTLFLSGGNETALRIGEAYWKMAHAAVITSWHRLVEASPTPAQSTNTQLINATLFSQAYAVMSGNNELQSRETGLLWAIRHYEPEQEHLLDLRMSTDPIDQQWRAWASSEVCRRALLGHYILDGLQSQISSLPNGIRHANNKIQLPQDDNTFEAPDAATWLQARQLNNLTASHPPMTFRQLLLQLFDPKQRISSLNWSHMTIPVVLEAIQSLIAEIRDAGGPSIGEPSLQELSQAMWRLYDQQITSSVRPAVDVSDLSIRWHTISIGLVVHIQDLIGALEDKFNIGDGTGNTNVLRNMSVLEDFPHSAQSKRALLHALAALDKIKGLPFRNMKAIHLPLAIYSAATVLIAFISQGGQHRVSVPNNVSWQIVSNNDAGDETTMNTTDLKTHHFIHSPNLCSDTEPYRGSPRNLLVDLNTSQTLLGSFPWPAAKNMQSRLQRVLLARRTTV